MKFKIQSLSELPLVARDFIEFAGDKKQFAFYGNMGVGKTTLIKAICARLNVIEVVTSPTFAIVNEYHTQIGELVYHFDFYRIRKLEELYDLGYEDYLYSSNYCFIEWPEMGEDLLPSQIVKVFLSELPDGTREMELFLTNN